MSSLSIEALWSMEEAVDRVKSNYHYRLYQNMDGGAGSGNWGHLGRKGIRGGSAPGGGKQNRRVIPHSEGKYTSWSKQRRAAAKEHRATPKELGQIPAGSVIVTSNGERYKKTVDGLFTNPETGKHTYLYALTEGTVRIAIPENTNPNVQKEIADFGGYLDRMEAAPRYESRKTVDGILREETGKVWSTLSEQDKDNLFYYTGGSSTAINMELRDGGSEARGRSIAKSIDKTSLPQDMWFVRGTSPGTAAKLFGISQEDMNAVIAGALPATSLVGASGCDRGFLSTGSTKNTGFEEGVALHIFAPKGTKAIYAEPWSANGFGAGASWDGKSAQEYFGDEFETILQCGTHLQTCRAWTEDGKVHIECFITAQDGLTDQQAEAGSGKPAKAKKGKKSKK